MEEWGASQVYPWLLWLLWSPRGLQTYRLLLLSVRQMLTPKASWTEMDMKGAQVSNCVGGCEKVSQWMAVGV